MATLFPAAPAITVHEVFSLVGPVIRR